MPLLIISLGIILQIFLTIKKVSPFISLLLVAILVGFSLGMNPSEILESVKRGTGGTLSNLALVITLGAILGKLLETSGATEQITATLIKKFGEKNVQWAILATGFLIGLPLYYNAGFVILVPLVFSISRNTRLPLLYIAIPMAASLSTTHCFLPPHPGPVFLINSFNADLGQTLVYGLILVIPIVIVSGIILSRLLKDAGYRMHDKEDSKQSTKHKAQVLPGVGLSFFLALFPVLLITSSVIANYFLPQGSMVRQIRSFTGDPTIALLLAVIMAIYFLGIKAGRKMEETMKWLNEGILSIAVILLIITAGGVLKQVLEDSGTGKYIASFSSDWKINPLVFAWLITAMLRVAIGSATVAGITAAGILSPIAAAGNVSPELMVIAVGAGSVFGSHINDSGFWMFKEYFNLSLRQTFLSWTIMETTISILGLGGVLLLQLII